MAQQSTENRIFSGIQPSGELHIGNYLGAIKHWVELINDYECYYCIVDYHAITINYDIDEFRRRVYNMAVDLIACGIDPSRSTIFIQSHVPEHTELAWVLSTVTSFGDLTRMTQFKDKSQQHASNINVGLFAYPVLQTADIALYKASLVPVGEDQLQHLELAREIIRSFNNKFKPIFPEPKARLTPAKRIMGLDGKQKMSKSLGNTIGIMDDEETLKQKILKKAVTDENRKRLSDPGDPEICNVFNYHRYFTDESTRNEIDENCRGAKIGCVDCKKILLKNIHTVLDPIREKREGLLKDESTVRDILNEGAEKSQSIARATMAEVRETIGVR